MPYERPGERFYAVATKEVLHGAPVIELGICGIAIKQQEPAYGTGLNQKTAANNPVATAIVIGENFVIDDKGVVLVPEVSGVTKGELVYIATADNTLSDAAGTGKVVFGRCVEVENVRGTPDGHIQVDLDLKV